MHAPRPVPWPCRTTRCRYRCWGGSLVNELDALDSPLVLVLDDYHRIDPASSVHEFLWFLLEHPPPALRLVLATRSDPTFSTGSLPHVLNKDNTDLGFYVFPVVGAGSPGNLSWHVTLRYRLWL